VHLWYVGRNVQGDPGEALDSQQGLRGEPGDPGRSGVPVSITVVLL